MLAQHYGSDEEEESQTIVQAKEIGLRLALEVKKLRKEKQTNEGTIDELLQQRNDLTRQNDDLRLRNKDLVQANMSLDTKCHSYAKLTRKLEDYIKESAAKHDTEVGGALHKNTYLADSNRELQKRLESVSEESLQYYKQVEDLRRDLATKCRDIELLQGQVESMAQHVKSTQQKCEEETLGAKATHAQLVQFKMQVHEQQLQIDSLESMLLRYKAECVELDGEKHALEQSVKNYSVLVQKQSAEMKDLKYQLLVCENNVEACCEKEKNELRLSAQQLQQDLNDARIRVNEYANEISNLKYIVTKGGTSGQSRSQHDIAPIAAEDCGASTSMSVPTSGASTTHSSTLYCSPASVSARTSPLPSVRVSPSTEEALRLSALSANQNDCISRELIRLERKHEKSVESLRKKKAEVDELKRELTNEQEKSRRLFDAVSIYEKLFDEQSIAQYDLGSSN